MKGRIDQYDLVENRDFVTFDAAPQNGGAGNRGQRVEYAITLDMAKELAIVERNAKGRKPGASLPNYGRPWSSIVAMGVGR